MDFIVNKLIDLIDYCEIHEDYLPKEGETNKKNRINDFSLLIGHMSRHLFLFFHCYPEAAKKLGCDLTLEAPDFEKLREVVDQFYTKFSTRWNSLNMIPKQTKEAFKQEFDKKFYSLMRGDDCPVSNLILKLINSRSSSPTRTPQSADLRAVDDTEDTPTASSGEEERSKPISPGK